MAAGSADGLVVTDVGSVKGLPHKEIHQVVGADHYYIQAAEKAAEAVGLVQDWMGRKGFA